MCCSTSVDVIIVQALADEYKICNAEIDSQGNDCRHQAGPESALMIVSQKHVTKEESGGQARKIDSVHSGDTCSASLTYPSE